MGTPIAGSLRLSSINKPKAKGVGRMGPVKKRKESSRICCVRRGSRSVENRTHLHVRAPECTLREFGEPAGE